MFGSTLFGSNGPTSDDSLLERLGPLQLLAGEMIAAVPHPPGPLVQALLALAESATITLGAIENLVRNGFGKDALSLSRSVFECTVSATYLRSDPSRAFDYLEFPKVVRKAFAGWLETDPAMASRLGPAFFAAVDSEYASVAQRFGTKSGKPRNQWHQVQIRQMANRTELQYLYNCLYPVMCAATHNGFLLTNPGAETNASDMGGLAANSAVLFGVMCLFELEDECQLGFEIRLKGVIGMSPTPGGTPAP